MWKVAVVALFDVIPWNVCGGIKENHEKTLQTVLLRGSEPSTSRIQVRSMTAWAKFLITLGSYGQDCHEQNILRCDAMQSGGNLPMFPKNILSPFFRIEL